MTEKGSSLEEDKKVGSEEERNARNEREGDSYCGR